MRLRRKKAVGIAVLLVTALVLWGNMVMAGPVEIVFWHHEAPHTGLLPFRR